jgi:predicted O-linked N-acetylglucosamine transferase (SPINDLY family)
MDKRNLGWRKGSQKNYLDALKIFNELEQEGENVSYELSHIAVGMADQCDWSMREELTRRLVGRLKYTPCILEPASLLYALDDPKIHQDMAAAISREIKVRYKLPARTFNHSRIRIGYLSGSFTNHPMSHLMHEIIAQHDKRQFEVFAYDYSAEDYSAIRHKVKNSFEHFYDMHKMTSEQIARKIFEDEIDILVDMMGYTTGSRPEILAYRPATVQISFLGYSGTTQSPSIDYVIADHVVLPETKEWSEKPLYLNHSYYPGGKRPLSVHTDKAANGLPDDKFIFACLNHSMKITPEVFSSWMNILERTPFSVLWLLETSIEAKTNLLAEATKKRIDTSRLIFAKPVGMAEHHSRLNCVDLFLDTFPYGGHTTSCDILWAGKPFLTIAGKSFASRVGASLLNDFSIPELITTSASSYQSMAIRIAKNATYLKSITKKIEDNKNKIPLFDSGRYTRSLEAAYKSVLSNIRQL